MIITNVTGCIDQDGFCGYKVSTGEIGQEVKPDCLLAARNSGQRARVGSASKISSPSMTVEDSVSARSASGVNS